MSDKKLGTDPAFAKSVFAQMGAIDPPQEGMSKRLWIATQIAANLFTEVIKTANAFPETRGKNAEEATTTSLAYKLTDELLKQENE